MKTWVRQAERGTDMHAYFRQMAQDWIAEADRIDAEEDELYGVEGTYGTTDWALIQTRLAEGIASLEQQAEKRTRTDRPVKRPPEPPDQDMLPELGASPN